MGREREPQFGIDLDKVALARDIQRDSRTPGQRFAAACRKPDVLGAACFALAGMVALFPAAVDLGVLAFAAIAALGGRIAPVLPLKLPATWRGADPHEREPGTGRPLPARGLLFLGNCRATGDELYESDADARTHTLVLGGTGAGKTEAMLGFCANALLWGSGFVYVDGKGDAALWAKVLALARACGREDDVCVMNSLTGSTDVDPDARPPNTFNPFARGSADAITQMLVAQMAEAGGDSATWKDRAIGLLTAHVRALVAMRDRGLDERGRPFALDAGALRAYLTLDNLIDLYLRAREGVDGFRLPAPALESLRAYLESVPGFQDPARLLEQRRQTLAPDLIRARAYPPQPDPQTYLQHGYLQNQFGRMFGQLADVYGHIFRAGHGEIDLADVVLQRRILVVMLPALEKSPDELASLGKLLIGALKTMLAIGLGARLEGTHREVIDRRPTNAPSPYLGVFDEYGYYAVKGFAVVPAQARSLGFSICFGGQDLQSFGKESREEAAAIVANTLTKIGMFVEDPKDTAELFEKLGGQAVTAQSGGLSKRDGGLFDGGGYRDATGATYERRARIDPLDLRAQTTGQALVVRGTTIIKARLFYPGAVRLAAYRLNRFAAAIAPDADDPALVAPTPEGVRAALARALAEAPLDALQMGALRAAGGVMDGAADGATDRATDRAARPDAGPSGRATGQTWAGGLIERYLAEHDALDAEFAARLREAAAWPAAPPAVSPVPDPAAPSTAPDAAVRPGPPPADRETAAAGEAGGAASGDSGGARGGATAPTAPTAPNSMAATSDAPDAPDAPIPSAELHAVVTVALAEKSRAASRPARRTAGGCYLGGLAAPYDEPDGEPDEEVPPPAEVEPPLGHAAARAASSFIGPGTGTGAGPPGAPRRAGRLPVVVVDRLEDLDGPETPTFHADARAVHLEIGENR